MHGVHAVITAADVPDVRYGAFLKDRTLFARDTVRWEGEVIAAVAAATPEIAARAAALIDVDLEPLAAIVDLEAAARVDAPLVHADLASYDADDNLVREGNVASRSTIVKGDAARAMAEADLVVKERYVADGSHAVPDRAAGDPRRVAGRSRDRLVLDPGAVRGPGRRRRHPRAARRTGSG